jgi:HEAT repeat protein
MTTLAAALLKNQAAPIDAVENALLRQSLYGGDLATNLLELAVIDEQRLLEQLALTFGMEMVDAGPLPQASEELKLALPAEAGARHCIFPLGIDGEDLIVAASVPLSPNTVEDLAFSLGYELRQRTALEVRIRQALSRDYRLPFAERFVRLSLSLDSGQPLNLSIPPPKVARRGVDPSRGETAPNEVPTTNIPTLVSSRAALLPQSVPVVVRPTSSKPKRRRLGPFTSAKAEQELKQAPSARDILKIWLDFSAQYFEYAAVFTVQGEMAGGFESRGVGPSSDHVARIGIPLEFPSVLADARRMGRFNLAALSSDGMNATLAKDLQRDLGRKVFAIPATLRGRAVALLYGDQGDADVYLEQVGEIVAIAPVIERALERVLVSRKRGQSIDPPEPSSRAPALESARGVSAPAAPAAPHQLQNVAAQDGSSDEQVPDTPRSGIPYLPVSSSAPSDINPEPIPLTRRSDLARPIVGIGSGQSSVPPKPEVSATTIQSSSSPARRLSLEPEPDLATDPRMLRSPSGQSGQYAQGLDTLASRADNDYEAKSLAIIRRIGAGDESAITDLLACGDAGASVLVRELPGTVSMPARAGRPDLGPIRASECGPLLRAMAAFGPTARPYVIARSSDPDPRVRQWTTRLLGELPGRQSALAVAQRLMHDRDAEVRRAAFAAGQLLTHDSESASALRSALSGAARNETLAVTQRLAALDALSDLRDGQAIPSISRLLLDPNPSIVATARQALNTLACRDFGHDFDAWSHWWGRNGHRHRVEWLIDALLDDSPPLRQGAAEELRTISRVYVGHHDDNLVEERVRIQDRYRNWWETTGKALLSPDPS